MENGSDVSENDMETLNNTTSIDEIPDIKIINRLYNCGVCDSKFKTRSHLLRHKRAKHEMIRYYREQCPYQANQPHSLKAQQESINKGVRYKC